MVSKTRRKINETLEEGGEDLIGLTQFEPHESDNSQTMWDVVAILQESRSKYRVQWAGIDPDTGAPWKPSWIPKEDCTNELIHDWKERKRKRLEARKLKNSTIQRSNSHASSKTGTRSSRTASVRESEDTVVLGNSRTPRGSLNPAITRKRQRSPSIVEEVPPATNSSAAGSDSDSPEIQRPHKKRRVVETVHTDYDVQPVPDFQEHDITPPVQRRNSMQISSPHLNGNSEVPQKQSEDSQDVSNSAENPESPQITWERTKEKRVSLSPQKPKSAPSLQIVPQLSPTIFRERMEPPLSQIEQFSTPGSSPYRSKHARDPGSREEPQPEPAEFRDESNMENAYDLIISQSRKHELRPKVAGNTWNSSPHASSPTQSSPYHSNQMSIGPFRRRSNTSLSFGVDQRADQLARMLSAKDAAISDMKELLSDRAADVADLEKRLAVLHADFREVMATVRSRDERIARLIDRMHEQGVSNALNAATILSPGLLARAGTPVAPSTLHVRSEEDETLISQLRAELEQLRIEKAASDAVIVQQRQELDQERVESTTTVAQVRGELAQARAEKAASDSMVEQARDVARRAEAAKTELAATERIARETARNAPKIAEELYRSAKEMAEAEANKYKVQLDLVLEQNRLTGDAIRKKAAKYDVLLPKYQKLSKKHEQMFEDMVETENEKEQLLQIMQILKELALQIGHGTADTSTYVQLAELLEGMQAIQSSDEQEDEEGDAGADGNADEDMTSGGEHGDSQPIIEEREQSSSYAGPDLGDPPTIFIEEMEEDPPGCATVASTQSEKSDGMAFMCLWTPSDDADTCQEYRVTKQSLRNHIFKEHLGDL